MYNNNFDRPTKKNLHKKLFLMLTFRGCGFTRLYITRGRQWCTLLPEFRGHVWIILGCCDESLLLQIEDGVADHICVVSLMEGGGGREG